MNKKLFFAAFLAAGLASGVQAGVDPDEKGYDEELAEMSQAAAGGAPPAMVNVTSKSAGRSVIAKKNANEVAVKKHIARKIKQEQERTAEMIEKGLAPQSLKKLPPMVPNRWVVNKGERLSDAITRWCKQEGWTLIWDADYDPVVAATVEFKGSFEKALTQIFTDLHANNAQFAIDFYNGNRVARVTYTASPQVEDE